MGFSFVLILASEALRGRLGEFLAGRRATLAAAGRPQGATT
jgi:hypothetical protein